MHPRKTAFLPGSFTYLAIGSVFDTKEREFWENCEITSSRFHICSSLLITPVDTQTRSLSLSTTAFRSVMRRTSKYLMEIRTQPSCSPVAQIVAQI